MKYGYSFLAASALFIAQAPRAQAHIDLVYPPQQQGNQKGAAPCGSQGAGPTTTLKPGETIMVRWNETTPHPGHFRIAFDSDGTDDFKDPTSYTDIKEPAVAPIMADGVLKHTNGGGMRQFMVTLPNVTCTKCTLQLLQIMQQGAFSPSNSLYRRCANIVLAGAAAGGGDGGAPDARRDGGSGSGGRGGQVDAGGGSGGASGSTGGSGGASTGAGGSSGSSGGSTGSAAAGGSSASSGGSSGASTGGSSGAPSGTAATGGSSKPATPSNSEAGGCSIGGRDTGTAGWALIALVIGLVLRARRRR